MPRNNIARLNTDGTLDTAFDPNANSIVFAIAVQPDGKILVGGAFSGANSIGGQNRRHIARLDGTTGLADSFDPNADSTVLAVAIQADGKILAGGQFTDIGGQPRVASPALMPTQASRTLSFRARTVPSSQSPCSRTVRFWQAANSRTLAGRRVSGWLGSMPRRAWLIPSIRARAVVSFQSQSRRTARFWRAAISRISGDSRATAWPGSMPRPAKLIRSTRMQMVCRLHRRAG